MLITISIFILILGLLVFVHEFGHFITAKKAGARVEEFGFGLPPRVFGVQLFKSKKLKKIDEEISVTAAIHERPVPGGEIVEEIITEKTREIDVVVPERRWKFISHNYDTAKDDNAPTVYSLNWIPLGGFVKIKGEEGAAANDSDSFSNKPIWKRAIVLSAGVIMNFILGAALLAIGFGVGLPQALEGADLSRATVREKTTQIVQVLGDYPAAKSGLAVGDAILTIDGQEISSEQFLRSYIEGSEGKELALQIKRNEKQLEIKAAPVILKETGKPGLGIAFIETGVVSYPWYLAIWKGIAAAGYYAKEIVLAFYHLIANLIVHREVAMDLSGPVGIAVLTGRVARLGLIYLLQFAAMLSINLAIINAFPFPALDGGRLLFLLIEKIRGRAMNQKIESLAHTAGYALLMLLIVAVTYRDISKFSYKFVELWQRLIN